MFDLTVNWIAVIVAAVAAFAFGALYYTLLAKQWMNALGTSEEELKKTQSAAPYVTSFISLIVMAFVLSAILAGIGGPSADKASAAVLLWLGLIATSMATNNAFQRQRMELTVIDSIHWLGVVIVQSIVISLF